MNIQSVFLAGFTLAYLTACGGGDTGLAEDKTTISAGDTIKATEGVFVMGSRLNYFMSATPYWQIVLEGGEVWIVKDFNSKGEPIFFATGNFRFTNRVNTVVNSTQTTITTTTTPERTITETKTVASDASASGAFQSNTHFKSDDALIAINSNRVATSTATYKENTLLGATAAAYAEVLTPDTGRGTRRGTDSNSPFAYDRPAATQPLAGSYEFAFNRAKVSMVVAGDGEFSGTNAVTGCSFTGSLTPHASGKNVFASRVTVSSCQDAGVYQGIAATYPQPDLNTGNGVLTDLKTASGDLVPAIFLAALNTDRSQLFSVAMFRKPI